MDTAKWRAELRHQGFLRVGAKAGLAGHDDRYLRAAEA